MNWKLIKGLNLKSLRWKIAVSCLIGVVRIAASMAFVWVSKALFDIATGVKDEPLGTYALIMVGIMLLQILSNTAASWWEGMIVAKARNGIRADVFRHVLDSEWHGREAFHSGDTVNRLEEDISVVVDLFCTRVPDVIVTLLQLLAASLFLFTLEPSLLWVILILMPVAVLGSKMFFKVIRDLTSKVRTKESEIQELMQENLQQRVLVKTLGRTEQVMEKMGWLQGSEMDSIVKRLNYNAIARSFMRFGFSAGYAAAFFWGVFGIKNGAVTYGMMTAFLQLVGQVQRPIADLGRHIPAFIQSITSLERLHDLLDLPAEQKGADILFDSAPGIKVDKVSFEYDDVPVEERRKILDAFSYDFKPGSVTAIMGLTGVGKSTITRLILGLLHPTEGEIILYSDEGAVPASPSTRCNFRYVPQGNTLMSGSVRENLLMANPSATEEEMIEALHTAVADFVMELPSGLDTVCSEKGSGLSEGQAQRVAIARALLHSGGVLILDEATSSLDAGTERLLLERLSEKYHGRKTILWITHRESVTSIADAVLKI